MNRKIVSIIVPAYNEELHIDRCLESIAGQTYKSLDILVIDDGSCDNTKKITQKYTNSDTRIRLLAGTHAGPNRAREIGVAAARGDYIMFIDADDYLAPGAVQTVVDVFAKYKPDIVVFNGMREENDRLIHYRILRKSVVKLNQEEAFTLLTTSVELNSLCLQAYNASLLSDTKAFRTKIHFGEDYLANLNIYQRVNNIALTNNVLYHYCNNKSSTTRSRRLGRTLKNVFCRIYISFKTIIISKKIIRDREVYRAIIRKQLRMIGGVAKTLTRVSFRERSEA